MKFELAAIDASQNREPQPVTPAGLGKGSGLAQFAARLEVDPWTSTVFDVAIKSPPVANGQRGADVLQRVRTNTGHECGIILWETKRARNWSKDWPAKLKEDQRAAKADLAVLVSEVLPPTVNGFGWSDGVWLCEATLAMPLAAALRQGVVTAAVARQNGEGRQSKMEQLFAYLTSLEFRQRVEGIVEAFKTMRNDLEAEKRALQKHWARREKQLDQALSHTVMLYGGVQGIVGQNALPDITPLQLTCPNEA